MMDKVDEFAIRIFAMESQYDDTKAMRVAYRLAYLMIATGEDFKRDRDKRKADSDADRKSTARSN